MRLSNESICTGTTSAMSTPRASWKKACHSRKSAICLVTLRSRRPNATTIQQPLALLEAAKRLETGESFTIPSQSARKKEKSEAISENVEAVNLSERKQLNGGDPGGD